MRLYVLFLVTMLLCVFPVQAQQSPTWTASGSLDTDGDGFFDRTLEHKGFDTDNDGLADRKVIISKEDKNNDRDFDDPDETVTESEDLNGPAEARIELLDEANQRLFVLVARDEDDDGKLETVTRSVCDLKRGALIFSATFGECGEFRIIAFVRESVIDAGTTGKFFNFDILAHSTLAHPQTGCQGSARRELQEQIFLGLRGNTMFRGHASDEDGDGSPDSFGTATLKSADSMRDANEPSSYHVPVQVVADHCESGYVPETGKLRIRDFNYDLRPDETAFLFMPPNSSATLNVSNCPPTIVPHAGNGQGLGTGFAISNTSAADTVRGVIQFVGANGTPQSMNVVGRGAVSRLEFEIAPLGKTAFETDGQGDVVVGSARIVADGDIGVVARFDLVGVGVAGVGASAPARAAIVPVRRFGDLSTGVALTNAVDFEIDVLFVLKDCDGNVVATAQDSMPGNGHDARFIEEVFPGMVPTDFEGTFCIFVLSESGSFSAEALELSVADRKFTKLPVGRLPLFQDPDTIVLDPVKFP